MLQTVLFHGEICSYCTPETPVSFHEGGELGYSLSHACGAAFDNPELIVAAVVGDGESETGPVRDLANSDNDLPAQGERPLIESTHAVPAALTPGELLDAPGLGCWLS